MSPLPVWYQLTFKLTPIAPHGAVVPQVPANGLHTVVSANTPPRAGAGFVVCCRADDLASAKQKARAACQRELTCLAIQEYLDPVLVDERELLPSLSERPPLCCTYWIVLPETHQEPVLPVPGKDALDRAVAQHAAKG